MMAEFNYFLTKCELVDILERAIEHGYTIQLNKNLDRPVPIFLRDLASIEYAIQNKDFAFVLTRNDLTRYPFKFEHFTRDGETFWYFRTRVGGPCIEIYFWNPYEKNGVRYVPCAEIAIYSKILHPETDEEELAGVAAKSLFSFFISPLRKSSKKVKSVKRTAYVSSGVMALLDSGYVLNEPFKNSSPV